MSAQFDVVSRRTLLQATQSLVRKSPGTITLKDITDITVPLTTLLSQIVGEECIIILRPKAEEPPK